MEVAPPPPPPPGFLHKQGTPTWFGVGAGTWSRRFFWLRGPALEYAKAPGEPAKVTLLLRGASVARAPDGGREHCARLALAGGGRSLLFCAESAAELMAWLVALDSAIASAPPLEGPAARTPVSSSGSSAPSTPSANAPRPDSWGFGGAAAAGVAAAAPSMDAPPEAAPPLPASVVCEGAAEVGSELRCRVRPQPQYDGAVLDNLCVAWFRLPAPVFPIPGPGSDDDAALQSGFRLIAGATAHTYLLTEADVGKFVGCLCRPAVGPGLRWSCQAVSVAPLDLSAPSARLVLQPHAHNKYCDRRVRVCTAPGRFREGEVLRLVARGGAPGALAGFRAVWYRSAIVDGSLLGSAPVSPASVPAAPQGDSLDLVAGVSFAPVSPRPVSDLAPAPPDSQPSPTVAEIRARLAPRLEAATAPAAGFPTYPLFKDDVGRMIMCVLLPKGANVPPTLQPRLVGGRHLVLADAAAADGAVLIPTLSVGPIEAAPPKAREIWVEGEPRVGCALRGNAYYFGGHEGASLVSWVAINEDGDVVDVRPPSACRPGFGAGDLGAEDGAGDREDPRVLRLTESLRGCMLKFRVQPVRSDGNVGHSESSRPTAEVA